jgi:hypothetical protein
MRAIHFSLLPRHSTSMMSTRKYLRVLIVIGLISLFHIEAYAITLTVTDGSIRSGHISDFAAFGGIGGKNFEVGWNPFHTGLSPSNLGGNAAGASVTLNSQMVLPIDSSFSLRDQPYRLDSGFLTFITDPIVLPQAQCTATPCPLPTINISAPFTMSGDLVISDDKHTFDVNLRGEGLATGTLISPHVPPETGWQFIALSYDFTDAHGPPTLVNPEPSSVLLLASGLAGLAAWRYRRSVR